MFGMGLRLHHKFTAGWLIAILILILPIFVHAEDFRIPLKATQKTAIIYFRAADLPARNFSARILVNPGGQAINAVGFTLNYPADKISITSISTANSFCTLFVYNNFDNISGKANLACGKPYPGINKTNEIMTINFTTKVTGFAKLNLSEAQVLANDGFGTDVLLSTSSKTVYIK